MRNIALIALEKISFQTQKRGSDAGMVWFHHPIIAAQFLGGSLKNAMDRRVKKDRNST